jgi:dTDP-4-amino-4,6-dideoxygalactose transaminase
MIRFNKPTIDRKDLESVLSCMITDDLTPGDYMHEFRKMLGRLLGLSTTAVFNSYYQAIDTAFRLIDAAPGDEVILPSYARSSLYRVVVSRGLKPVPVDLKEDSLLPSREQIRQRVNIRTACVIVQQLFGIPNDLADYTDFGVPLIEDLDGALSSGIGEHSIGGFGSLVTVRLNDEASITTGDGGMLAAGNGSLKKSCDDFVRQAAAHAYDYLMSDLNASLGISQLKKLDKIRQRRQKIGEYYDEAVMASNCSLVGREDGQRLSYTSYPVLTSTPFEDCSRFFKKYGIPIQRGIEAPLHRIMGLPPGDFPRTEGMHNRIIQLPIYPTLEQETVENVAKGVRAIL